MIVVVFPGQGSQKPGMGRELCESSPRAAEVFDAVSSGTGIDARKVCWELDEETLRQTENAQLALYTCGVAAFRAMGDSVEVHAMAGHSIGEYSALACAGAFSIEDGARLVQRRGQLMAQSGRQTPGTMAAILGLERDLLEAVCAATVGIVVIANDNSPGQLVISGEIEAVKAACESALPAGAKRALMLNVSGAFHSPLMDLPSREMGESIRDIEFNSTRCDVVSNVIARPGKDWQLLLEQQLNSPVRWTESMQFLVESGLTTMIECGSGEVLCGLMKRIDRSVKSVSIQDAASLAVALETLRS